MKLDFLGTGLGAAGGLFGSLGKNKMVREQMRMLQQEKNENQDWFDRRYNEDATQRGDALRLLNMTEESIKRRNRAAAGAAAVMGGTGESVAAEKAAGNQALADAAGQIAAAADARKDAIERQYLERKANLDGKMRGVEAEKQNEWDFVNNVVGGAAAGAGYDVS